MALNFERCRGLLREGAFRRLFINELGWDNYSHTFDATVGGAIYKLNAVAEKRGFVAYTCTAANRKLPTHSTRQKIERQIVKLAQQHLVVYTDGAKGDQVWQWVKREPNKQLAWRYHFYNSSQPGDSLIGKLESIAFSIEAEENLTHLDVTGSVGKAFDVERITKKFYEVFRKEHHAFLEFIAGIAEVADREWYASLILNRLMFVYFIQKKGFLDGDHGYLVNRLKKSQEQFGADRFHSFYRHFLLRLFQKGLGGRERDAQLDTLLGKVPYLNGGLFDEHDLERRYPEIQIPDAAFKRLFNFFDEYQWRLDDRPLHKDTEINPDVLGYIFEKYVNQKQMGAYYTKEDITEYIAQNTIIPFILNRTRQGCLVAFEGEQSVWRLLRENPSRYIYDAVTKGAELTLPDEIAIGLKDVSKRGLWNRLATDEYALPTETWREVVARRQLHESVVAKLEAGGVSSVEDLITLNLNIRQFARDVVEIGGGTELLQSLWNALTKVSVLDPTCGSGAFLFSALNVLEPLYDACLGQMEALLADAAHLGRAITSGPLLAFRKVLDDVERHPNHRYYILKSIIVNNLYGVDIMEEAVEIAKLRLFLKLVAQIESVSEVEPLPDIDFNIRAGNTLVGYATREDIRRALAPRGDPVEVLGMVHEQLSMALLDNDQAAALSAIEHTASEVDRQFQAFQKLQIDLRIPDGGAAVKNDLRAALAKLTAELDGYLAVEHGVKTTDEEAFAAWKKSHQPFHWFAEFYGIMIKGGFDVIIGNPPYVEYKDVCTQYKVIGFDTENCNNLFAYSLERAISLTPNSAGIGMIVPLSAFSTDRMIPLITKIKSASTVCHISNYSWRPGKLFDGVNLQLSIALFRRGKGPGILFSTRYILWDSSARSELFSKVEYAQVTDERLAGSIPKLGAREAASILTKLRLRESELGECVDSGENNQIYYRRGGLYWKVFVDFITGSSEEKKLPLRYGVDKYAVIAVLSSNLWFWYLTATSDCRHLGNRDINSFPFNHNKINFTDRNCLSNLGMKYVKDLRTNAVNKVRIYKGKKAVQCLAFEVKRSKEIIDQIDTIIGRCCGFTDKELDFIINYDIKYRMGAEADED